MWKYVAAAAVAATAAGAAQAGDVTQTRTVGAFQSVRLEGAADVSIKIGPAVSVSVSADEAVAPLVTTEVRKGALVIGFQKGAKSPRKGKIRVEITTPSLDGIALSGAGSIHAQGVTGERFQAELSGAGKLMCDGSVRQVKVTLSGAGDATLNRLSAHDAEVTLSGTGKVQVHATDSLQARLSGVGEVRYDGKPARIDSKVSGIGKVRAN